MTDVSKMTYRIKQMYVRLYESPLSCTKEKLADFYKVTTKTIENSLKNFEDIVYDKKLKRYRFSSLLPAYIPYRIFYAIFNDAISNKELKKDFSLVENLTNNNDEIFMINTSSLSELSKKTIMIYLAIENNCVLKVKYFKKLDELEPKYIKPNTLLLNSNIIYITYDKRNKKDAGKERTFKLNKIESIEPIEYTSNEVFKKYKIGNAFGEFKKDKYVTLVFDKVSSSYFQSSNLFENNQFEAVIGIGTENTIVKMYYNELNIEVIKIIQQWMPRIKIHEDEPLKENIEEIIKKNYHELITEENRKTN